ncbi:MAG: hypothetical protein KJS77_10825, partial [Planctomycetes bacterium]|nr:hypothetical protein [Planctomycetota bacterium]
LPSPGLPSPGLPSPGLPSPGLPSPGLPSPGLPSPGLPSPDLPSPDLPPPEAPPLHDAQPSLPHGFPSEPAQAGGFSPAEAGESCFGFWSEFLADDWPPLGSRDSSPCEPFFGASLGFRPSPDSRASSFRPPSFDSRGCA